jgi:uncharacterized protein YndB with AHSA1/START domain
LQDPEHLMISKIAFFLAVVIGGVLLFATTRPNSMLIRHSIVIKAQPEKVFPLLNDFHNWPLWASQDKDDPTMTRTYSGPTGGAGAISDWTSKGDAGSGEMTITASKPTRIHVKVDFVKPFRVRNAHEITVEPVLGGGTRVTWTANVQNIYLMKVMGIFINMQNKMDQHFQDSLDNLKEVAEH